jgi:hypothetical protein
MRRICLSLLVLVLAAACVAPNTSSRSGKRGDNLGFAFYGGQLSDPVHVRNADLDRARNAGAKWVRLSLNWITLEPHRKGQFNWGPSDALVNAAKARGFRINAISAYTPPWARPGGTPGTFPPSRAQDFADFLHAAARRYAAQIDAWEIWNEPNLFTMWSPRPNVAAYTNLLKAAYPAIKSADPSATVVTGGMSPAYDAPDGKQILPRTFVRGIYAHGGGRSFDAIGHHPSSFPTPSTYRADWNAFQQTAHLYNEMKVRGDGGKKVWGTELAFPTGNHREAVSEPVQGDRYVEAFRAWQSWSFTGPLFVYSLRDQSNGGDRYSSSGIYRNNGAAKASVGKITGGMNERR